MYYSQDSLSPPHAQVHPRDHDLLVLGELRMGIIVFVFKERQLNKVDCFKCYINRVKES